jgi:hypothetical protein
MILVVFALCTGAGYFAGQFIPESPATPYLPLLISYHLFVLYLVAHVGVTGEQKLGLSLPLPLAILSHLACVGAMIGMVMGRQEVPLFGLLQYAVPSLAPFEVNWIFEGAKSRHVSVEPNHMPAGSSDDYADFLLYLKQGKRRFQRGGRSINDEYAAWLTERNKKRAVAD